MYIRPFYLYWLFGGVAADEKWQQIMDERFDDERMARIYPKAKNVN